MKSTSNVVQLYNFVLSLSQFLKNFSKISKSSELQKFRTHNTKAMVNDDKVNIAVT